MVDQHIINSLPEFYCSNYQRFDNETPVDLSLYPYNSGWTPEKLNQAFDIIKSVSTPKFKAIFQQPQTYFFQPRTPEEKAPLREIYYNMLVYVMTLESSDISHFCIHSCDFTPEQTTHLLTLIDKSKIKYMRLNYNTINATVLRHVVDIITHCPKLTHISLYDCDMSLRQWEIVINAIKESPSINFFGFSTEYLQDDANILKNIAELFVYNKNLTHFWIDFRSDWKYEEETIDLIKAVIKTNQMEEIVVSHKGKDHDIRPEPSKVVFRIIETLENNYKIEEMTFDNHMHIWSENPNHHRVMEKLSHVLDHNYHMEYCSLASFKKSRPIVKDCRDKLERNRENNKKRNSKLFDIIWKELNPNPYDFLQYIISNKKPRWE